MASQTEAIEIIRDNIDRDDRIPDEMEYVIHEADPSNTHANVSLPLIEFQMLDTTRDDLNNTNRTEFVYDSNGNRVGEIYQLKWKMRLQMDIWTAQGSDYDPSELGKVLRTVLYDHDVKGPAEPFETDEGEPFDDIWDFQIEQGERVDDLTQTPTIRRHRQFATVRGYEEYRRTGQDTIKTVDQTTSTQ